MKIHRLFCKILFNLNVLVLPKIKLPVKKGLLNPF